MFVRSFLNLNFAGAIVGDKVANVAKAVNGVRNCSCSALSTL